MSEKVDKGAIKAFWEAHVEELDEGCMRGQLMEGAYDCGCVVVDYWDRVEGLDQRSINDAPAEFLKTLSEDQLLGCIAWHFRADHFDNYHFYEKETVLALQRIVYAWLAKVGEMKTYEIDCITYVLRACSLAPDDALDPKVTVSIYPDGKAKVSKCLMSRKTGRVVKGTTESKKVQVSKARASRLFEEISGNDFLVSNGRIDLDMCDAIAYIQLKSSTKPNKKPSSSDNIEEAFLLIRQIKDLLREAGEIAKVRLPL